MNAVLLPAIGEYRVIVPIVINPAGSLIANSLMLYSFVLSS